MIFKLLREGEIVEVNKERSNLVPSIYTINQIFNKDDMPQLNYNLGIKTDDSFYSLKIKVQTSLISTIQNREGLIFV